MNDIYDSKPLDATVVDSFDEWAIRTPDRVAAEWLGETLTYAALRNASLHVSRALLSAGVQPRDNVPLLTSMSLEMLPAILGILRVGACYAPMDVSAWNPSRIDGALSNLSSSVGLTTIQCSVHEPPPIMIDFQKEWLDCPLENADELHVRLNNLKKTFREDDLAWILFTSGTTGRPKGVMVYHKAAYAYSLLELMKPDTELRIEAAVEVRNLLAFSVGFDGCASVVWTTLTKGHTLVMASASNFPEAATTCDALMLTPSMLSLLDPSGPYDRVRYIFMGAEDPSMEVVRLWIRPGRKVFTTYGPTETTCIITLGELKPDEEVTFGDLLPGVKIALVDEDLQECVGHGELLIGGPGVGAGYINNPDMTAKKFICWQGERFYRTGDLAYRTADGRLKWGGRADSLVKNRGFLINLESEVEPALLSYPSVKAAVALKWRERLIGFVSPDTVNTEELRQSLRERFDDFVVPDEIVALPNLPLNVNSKIDRPALKAQLEDRVTQNDESLSSGGHLNPSDALRLAFSECLFVAMKELDITSSFNSLGGNSFTAMRIANFLKKKGYLISAVQILRLDTITLLEESLVNLSNVVESEQSDNDSGYHSEGALVTPATPAQTVFLSRSLENPIPCALIGVVEYVGKSLTAPTATELHGAFITALSAHDVFQTRFDMSDLKSLTVSKLDRLNLDWHEVSVSEAEFENACTAAEEQAWLDMRSVGQAENEVPYFHITCVSVPGRKALAYVTRIHHVLMDVVSQAILSADVDRALAGQQIHRGPRMQEFARFMHKYKQDNYESLISTFESMVKPIPVTSVLRPPKPQTPLPQPLPSSFMERTFDLIRLDASTSLAKSTVDATVRTQRVTSSTLVYAAWSLFLSKITSWHQVGFRISLSGRTVPYPPAQSIVGALTDSAPFSTPVHAHLTVHEWLVQVKKTTLDVLEFDGLAFALPDSYRADPRTNTTNVLCFLDVPQPTTPNWTYREKQRHNYLIDWYVFQEGENVKTVFEIQSGSVDLVWAKDVASIPSRMLEGLVNATEETRVADLLY